MGKSGESVWLEFSPPPSENAPDVRDDLSAVARTERNLWIASDETASIERLSQLEDGSYGRHVSYRLADFVDLPGEEEDEADIEAMSVSGDYLWVCGSHSLKRKKAVKDEDLPLVEEQAISPKKMMKRLATLKRDPNRYLIARIPLALDPETGERQPVSSFDTAAGTRTAAILNGDDEGNELTAALADDPHLSPFIRLPGKDNGLDIEGMAADGNRLMIGLRGPVLRGWALVLGIEVEECGKKKGRLKLRSLGAGNGDGEERFSKHFLQCEGRGVRDLCRDDDDLLVLAGPTLDVGGAYSIYRWKRGMRASADSMVGTGPSGELEKVLDLPHGQARRDKAEGLTLLADGRALIVYDDPSASRKKGLTRVKADIFSLPSKD